MSGTEAITDEVVGKAYMENFAGNIFTAADDEERARKATRTTAAKFFAAAQFMEVLQCFGDLDKEVPSPRPAPLILRAVLWANGRLRIRLSTPSFSVLGF